MAAMKFAITRRSGGAAGAAPGKALAALLTLSLLLTACASRPAGPPPANRAEQQALTPAQVRDRLAAGNERFVTGRPLHRDWARERAATANGQFPYAVVLGCVDSRVPGEVIFDQGLGEIFNARIAGNVLDDEILGSLEFACAAAGARLITVLGHTQCGAVKAACSGAELGHLNALLARIRPSVEAVRSERPAGAAVDDRFVAEVTERNVRRTIEQIRERSPLLRELVDSGKVGVVGGIYELETGRVRFLGE